MTFGVHLTVVLLFVYHFADCLMVKCIGLNCQNNFHFDITGVSSELILLSVIMEKSENN